MLKPSGKWLMNAIKYGTMPLNNQKITLGFPFHKSVGFQHNLLLTISRKHQKKYVKIEVSLLIPQQHKE